MFGIHLGREGKADRRGLNFGWVRGPIVTLVLSDHYYRTRYRLRLRVMDSIKLFCSKEEWTIEDDIEALLFSRNLLNQNNTETIVLNSLEEL